MLYVQSLSTIFVSPLFLVSMKTTKAKFKINVLFKEFLGEKTEKKVAWLLFLIPSVLKLGDLSFRISYVMNRNTYVYLLKCLKILEHVPSMLSLIEHTLHIL